MASRRAATRQDKTAANRRVTVEDMARRNQALAARITELEKALARVMLDVDFMVERDVIPDVRDDITYAEAYRVLPNYEAINDTPKRNPHVKP